MTSDRPYRSALTHEEALAEVERCAGTQFDPKIARVFLEVFREVELPAAAAS
jgi:HD-GYP domain-containing protein (c-di-GMP phosphodiesterase class II)